ncbi:MAG TPA: serpin family protein [Exilispira sp.]|nr:serpin family protein [Exilispira sp.]
MRKKLFVKIIFVLIILLSLSLSLFSFASDGSNNENRDGKFKKIFEDKYSTSFKILSSNIDLNKNLLINLIDFQKEESIFYSPFGIQILFSLLLNAVRKDNLKQLQDYLYYSDFDILTINRYYQSVLQNITKNNFRSLKLANSFWINKGSDFYNKISIEKEKLISEDFLKVAFQYYFTDIFEKDLLKASEFKLLENWVLKKTENKIKNFIDKNSINKDIIALLINTLYFNEKWLFPFDVKNTKVDDFVRLDYNKIKNNFMNFSSAQNLYYYEDDLLQAVRLPYKNYENSLIVILPKDIDQTIELTSFLNANKFLQILEVMKLKKGYVKFPKIKLEYKYDLKEILKISGLTNIFNPSHDFTPLFNQKIKDIEKELFKIDKVFQKTYLEIDEKGTIASAATGISIIRVTKAINENIFYFDADHPFFYFLIDETSGNIIFCGFYNG